MHKVMYGINWHSVEDSFSHCTVTPITVVREGIMPGCTGVTITAINSDGGKFIGNPNNYFNSEAEAWADVKEELKDAIIMREKQLADLTAELNHIRKYLESLS